MNRPAHHQSERVNYGGDGQRFGARTSSQIRAEMDHTRAQLDCTIDQLQERLSPQRYIKAASEALRESAGDVTGRIFGAVRANPLPIALIGAGVIWLAVSQARRTRLAPRPRAVVIYEKEEDFMEAAL